MAELESRQRGLRPKTIGFATVIVITVAFMFYWLLARAIQGINYRLTPSASVDNLLDNLPLLEPFVFIFELGSPYVLRHLLPIAFGIACGWIITIRLVEKLYNLPSFGDASRTLSRLVSGTGGTVAINRLKFAEQRVEEELLRIGGPGFVAIAESDVVVTEINGRFERVLGGGKQRLRRFEKVVAALDLREQERERQSITLMTKEGLELKTNLRLNFYLRRRPDPRKPKLNYTFDDDSVRKAAYSVTIGEGGILRWDDQPMRVAVAQLRRVVASKRLDELIDPRYVFEGAPHPDIQLEMERDTLSILHLQGIHLVRAQMSTLEMSGTMHETLIGYWKAFGEKAKALDERPQDPDYDSADIARRRAREKMIASLTTGLQTIRERKNATPRRANTASAQQTPDINQLLTIQLMRLLENVANQQQLKPPQPSERPTNDQALIEAPSKDLDNQLESLLRRYLPPAE